MLWFVSWSDCTTPGQRRESRCRRAGNSYVESGCSTLGWRDCCDAAIHATAEAFDAPHGRNKLRAAARGPVGVAGPIGEIGEIALLGMNQLLALVLLLLLAPVMAIVALLIFSRDGAPILFGHFRVGCDGRLFRCLKFRTMRRDSAEVLERLLRDDPQARAEWQKDQKLSDDPRITAIGHFLRRSSLDELPQLFNVLRGEMSLVGPRPITVDELTRYRMVRWHY